MRSLVVAGKLYGRGGVETCLRTLAEEATARGDDVHILALAPSQTSGAWHEGLPYSEVSGSGSALRQWTAGLMAIAGTLRRFRSDVVIALFCGTLPLVRAAQLLARSRAPLVAWLHFSFAVKQRTEFLRLAARHLCINAEIAGEVRALRGIRAGDVAVVYNGTDLAVSTISRPKGVPLRIVYVGRLMIGGQKRADDLLRALAAVGASFRLDVVGGGGDQPVLEVLAGTLGIANRVRWWGWQEQPWTVVDAAHLLVMPSAFEGFGMVLVEATARGVACLSTGCRSGPSEIIADGETGWLYPVGDVAELPRRIKAIACGDVPLPDQATVRTGAQSFSCAASYVRMRAVLAKVAAPQE